MGAFASHMFGSANQADSAHPWSSSPSSARTCRGAAWIARSFIANCNNGSQKTNPTLMGGESTPSRAVVQSAGAAYRLTATAIKDEFSRAPVLHLLLRYTQALITQMAQTAV